MPKIFNKEIPSIVIVGGGLVAIVLGYNALNPQAEPVRSSITKGTPKNSGVASGPYTTEDYTIRFVSSATKQPRDAFVPLVVRKGGSAAQGGIPTTFTGGEANWTFTGMATVNGSAQGLLENKSGDSEFVTVGQHWKSSTIGAITPDTLILAGPGDSQYVAAVTSASEPAAVADVNSSVGPVTIPPGMMGAIGGNNPTVPGMPGGAGGNGGYGGYGRRRRNRGFGGPGN